MLGGDAVGKRHRFVEAATRMIAPKPSHEARAMACRGSVFELALDGAGDGGGELVAVGDQDRLGCFVVLGLGQKVGGDPFGVGVLVGDHQHLRGAGDHVDATLPKTMRLAAAT